LGDPLASDKVSGLFWASDEGISGQHISGAVTQNNNIYAITGKPKIAPTDSDQSLYLRYIEPPSQISLTGASSLPGDLAGSIINPSFSPDGTKIVFATDSNSALIGAANPTFKYQVVIKDLTTNQYTTLSVST